MGLDPVELLFVAVSLVPEAFSEPVAELHAGVATDQSIAVLPKNLLCPWTTFPRAHSLSPSTRETDMSFHRQ